MRSSLANYEDYYLINPKESSLYLYCQTLLMEKDEPSQYIVLYADDDEDDVDIMVEAFSRYSFKISLIAKNDGLELIDFLNGISTKQKLPCLIILDINMPRMDGKETLKQLRKIEIYKNVPMVLFTTSYSAQDAHFAKLYNAGYLTKPINVSQIESIASQFIEHCSEEVKKDIL